MMPSGRPLRTVAAPLFLFVGASAAEAQIALIGGFTPDPYEAALAAVAATPAAEAVRGCPGHAPVAAALDVDLAGATAPLRFYARGEGLAALLVEGPDGVSRCAPAGAEGVAFVRFERPLDGRYAVSPAAAEPGAAFAGALFLSELDYDPAAFAGDAAPGAAVDPAEFLALDAPPASGRIEPPADGAARLVVSLAPTADASPLGAGCAGGIDPSRPDAVVTLGEGGGALHIAARSEADTTLVVIDPLGGLLCSDDAWGRDPAVSVREDAPTGDWRVWLGLWSSETAEATLFASLSEIAAPDAPAPVSLAADAEPAAGRHALPPEGGLAIDLALSGVESAGGVDPACAGAIDPSRPDVVVTLGAPEPMLSLRARSEFDATLVVVDPSGAVHCNDDAVGLDPGLTFAPAEAGDWRVWVGLWGGAEGAALLEASRNPPDAAAADDPAETPPSPFLGRTFASAADVLAFALTEEGGGLGEALSWETMEASDPEGFTLTGVLVRDPSGVEAPIGVERIVVSDLDLASLTAVGQPDRFALSVEGIDLVRLAEAAAAQGQPLPAPAGATAASLAISMLPPDDAPERRVIRLAFDAAGMGGAALSARVALPEDPAAAFVAPGATPAESLEFAFRDEGLFAALLAEQAAAAGIAPEALAAEWREALAALFGGAAPPDPRAALFAALDGRLAAFDRQGLLTIRLRPSTPAPFEGMVGALMDPAGPTPQSLGLEAAFTPSP